jgi:hypothetical protein
MPVLPDPPLPHLSGRTGQPVRRYPRRRHDRQSARIGRPRSFRSTQNGDRGTGTSTRGKRYPPYRSAIAPEPALTVLDAELGDLGAQSLSR